MRTLGRSIFREIFVTAILGAVLFTFLIFLLRARPLFEFLVRTGGSHWVVAKLFLLVLPQALPFTVPLGVLVAVLIGLSRMSADGEFTAMRASGIPARRIVPTVVFFGAVAMCVAAAASLWLTPWSIRERYRVENQLIKDGFGTDIQPRIFSEQFPNSVLYVTDVAAGINGRWKKVLMADVTPPEKRPPGLERGDGPRITLASDAVVLNDPQQNRLQLSLRNGSTYETGKELKDYHITSFPDGDQALEAKKPAEVRSSRPVMEMDLGPLYRMAYKDASAAARKQAVPSSAAQIPVAQSATENLDARIELHQRLALPVACLLMALIGVPLGITRRRAGRSAAVVLTFALAFVYYMTLISFISVARQGTLRPELAVWLPNILFAVGGIILVIRLERPGDHDLLGGLSARLRRLRGASFEGNRGGGLFDKITWPGSSFWFPQVTDGYVLSGFVFYLFVLLASFVLMFQVFTFFELLSDIIRNHISWGVVLAYHFYLTPRLLYELAPFAVLTAVLVTFGVLSKHNEVTAFKACGVSSYRLAAPVLVAGLALSGGLFLFDHYWVPDADRRQDALRAEIKGRPAQTFLRPDRKWISGIKDRMYYYRYFDQAERVMVGVNVYEIEPASFRLKRHISAERARWEPSLKSWIFENGWSRDMTGTKVTHFDPFPNATRTFTELDEPPDYFVKEVKQSRQMNYHELGAYIAELQQSGLDTVALQVQLQKKFSVPLFALIMAMVSIPFAFMTGNRGAMAGVGLSLGIAIVYWSVGQVFEQFGNLNQLPVQIAAWAPNVIFSLCGLYFLARMRT